MFSPNQFVSSIFLLTISHDFHSSFTCEFNHCAVNLITQTKIVRKGAIKMIVVIKHASALRRAAPMISRFLSFPLHRKVLSIYYCRYLCLLFLHLIVVWKKHKLFYMAPMRLLTNGYRPSELKFADGKT